MTFSDLESTKHHVCLLRRENPTKTTEPSLMMDLHYIIHWQIRQHALYLAAVNYIHEK